jgi:ribosome-associated protein
MEDLVVSPRCMLAAALFVVQAVRSPGPGGQNVNKVSSKIELRFNIDACDALSLAAKARLCSLQKNRLDAAGWLLVTSSESRSQHTNLELARDKVAAFVRAALTPPKPRKATTPSKGSVRRRLEGKSIQSTKKAQRRTKADD